MKLPLLMKEGTRQEITIPDGVLDIAVHPDVIQQAVEWSQAARQRGTHKAKTRAEVRGGGKKPWAQKGTGRARHGSIRSPVWVGGGKTFGPTPRSHKKGLPRKVRKLALQMALADKALGGKLFVAEDLLPSTPKTKEMVQLMGKWDGLEKPFLLLVGDLPEVLDRAARNIEWADIAIWPAVTVEEVLRARSVVLAQTAMSKVIEGMTKS